LWVAAGIAGSAWASAWFFFQVNEEAGKYLLPYCVWVTFAFFLNWRISVLNPIANAAASAKAKIVKKLK